MENQTPGRRSQPALTWFVLFFGIACFTQRFALGGLFELSLTNYYKDVLHLGPKAVAAATWFIGIPFVIKPIYGLLSDFYPIFGSRRKLYLMVLNSLAVGAFIWLSGLRTIHEIAIAMTLCAFFTAFSDVLINALVVELGNSSGTTKIYQSHQFIWTNIATIATSIAGGYFAQRLGPERGFQLGALLTALAPLALAIVSWTVLYEESFSERWRRLKEKAKENGNGNGKEKGKGKGNENAGEPHAAIFPTIMSALHPRNIGQGIACMFVALRRALVAMLRKTIEFVASNLRWQVLPASARHLKRISSRFMVLWGAFAGVVLFISYWQFSTSFVAVSQYYHMTNTLGLSPKYFVVASIVGSGAAALGAYLFRAFIARWYTTEQLLYRAVFIGTSNTLGYLLIADNRVATLLGQYVSPWYTGWALACVLGCLSMFAILTVLNLGAESCPRNMEAVAFAIVAGLYEGASRLGQYVGATLYEDWLGSSLTWLIFISAALTLLCIVFVKLLPEVKNKLKVD